MTLDVFTSASFKFERGKLPHAACPGTPSCCPYVPGLHDAGPHVLVHHAAGPCVLAFHAAGPYVLKFLPPGSKSWYLILLVPMS